MALQITGYSTQAAFFDYDKDGDLDCFIINHSIQKYTAGLQENPELRKQHNPAFAINYTVTIMVILLM